MDNILIDQAKLLWQASNLVNDQAKITFSKSDKPQEQALAQSEGRRGE